MIPEVVDVQVMPDGVEVQVMPDGVEVQVIPDLPAVQVIPDALASLEELGAAAIESAARMPTMATVRRFGADRALTAGLPVDVANGAGDLVPTRYPSP